jgi:uncharacterized protein (TIGR02284 family)
MRRRGTSPALHKARARPVIIPAAVAALVEQQGTSIMSHRFTIDALKELIAARRDGAQGLRICSEYVRNPRLEALLRSHLEEATRALEELQSLVRLLGGDPDLRVRDPVLAYQRWTDLRSALACNEDGVILDECERGESRALEVYRNAMDDPLPGLVRAIVLRQFEDVMTNHDQIRDLRNQWPPLVDSGAGSSAQAGQLQS